MWNSQGTGNSSSSTQPRGILRKTNKATRYHFQRPRHQESEVEKDEELLVFGYACKIFPPNDHSRDIAKGKHLIPWNGDHNLQLMIDRYDARASLHDLSDFDGDSWNTEYEISEEEARIEQLCDQERYMAMYTDIAEEKIRHEEELKRLHASIAGDDSTFKQVGFNYDDQPTVTETDTKINDQPQTAVTQEEEKPFMAPESLSIPLDMEIPPTEKMHAIIEKTAGFVSKQGTQMEIILKAKQANSSQFLFLDFDHYLNPYYKHILQRIKEGKYTINVNNEQNEEAEEDEDSDSDDDGGGYLHPSLFASAHKVDKEEEEKKKEKLKAIQKVDPNHPLAKLIEKGKRANALKQYNIMKTAVQNFNSGKENTLEPPPLPKFLLEEERNWSNSSSPVNVQEQETTPASTVPSMVIVPPPPDIQPMVDSVAKQVAEDGDAVEQAMCSRKDPLLAFLEPSHELHAYYTFRKTFIREQLKAQKKLEQQMQEAAEAEKLKQSGPISFSIKGKDVAPKTTLISTRLQALGDDSGSEGEGGENSKASENKENEKNSDKPKDESKTASKRKFVEITVIEAVKPSTKKDDNAVVSATEPTMSDEDRKRLLAQTKRKFTDGPPLIAPVPASISNFTVVTPDGNTMSIAEFRERQAERRQKAAELATQKAKEDAAAAMAAVAKPEQVPAKVLAAQDIFDLSEEDDNVKPDNKRTTTVSVGGQESSSSIESISNKGSPAREQSSAGRKSSPSSLPSQPPAMTLKDLVVAASRSSTPSSRERKRSHSRTYERSRSRSRSRPRQSSHRIRSRSRSRDRDRGFVSSSYKKMLGSSSYRGSSSSRSRYNEDENVPSAYKIENTSSSYYRNGNYSRSSRRDISPVRSSRNHKRHRPDSDKDEDRKNRKSHSIESHKSKRKRSKSKKKHKKKKSKGKKKDKGHSSSEDGEWSSNSDSSERSEAPKGEVQEKPNGKTTSEDTAVISDKEEGELAT